MDDKEIEFKKQVLADRIRSLLGNNLITHGSDVSFKPENIIEEAILFGQSHMRQRAIDELKSYYIGVGMPVEAGNVPVDIIKNIKL